MQKRKLMYTGWNLPSAGRLIARVKAARQEPSIEAPVNGSSNYKQQICSCKSRLNAGKSVPFSNGWSIWRYSDVCYKIIGSDNAFSADNQQERFRRKVVKSSETIRRPPMKIVRWYSPTSWATMRLRKTGASNKVNCSMVKAYRYGRCHSKILLYAGIT